MIEEPRHIGAEVAIVGTGIAGFAAAVFALDRGLRVAQIGNTGALAYTTGYLDLLGHHDGALVDDPWRAIDDLATREPGHPLGRLTRAEIEQALRRFAEALSELGIAYTAPGDRNLTALLPAGLAKPTCGMPRTMRAGASALADTKRTLIIDFAGLAGFSAKEFVANLTPQWPTLSTARIAFPDMEDGAELFAEVAARALEVPAHRAELADRIRAVLGDAEVVGMPAILGISAPDRVHAAMEELIGVPLFEIPTMPPAVPGTRLRELFEQKLPARGVQLAAQRKVERATRRETGIDLHFHDNFGPVVIAAETALLATGRFLSGGLVADRGGIREPLFDLTVTQPDGRDDWYHTDYFDPRGHAINRSGLAVDDAFRPIDAAGKPVSERLFAAGTVLANQDWIRQRCGAGLAIASAWRAIDRIADLIGRT